MSNVIVLVAGKNPLAGMGGGPAYVRAHARAASRAGFEPHIFYAGPVVKVVKTDYGFVHQARSLPLNPFPQNGGIAFNKLIMGWQAPRVAVEIERFLSAQPGPHLIHGFSSWGYTALLAGERLRGAGTESVVVNTVYTTAEYESRVKAAGMNHYPGRFKRAAAQLEYAMVKRTVAHYEGRVFAESRLVIVNYDSVHRIFVNDYGPNAAVLKLPYASESAFLHQHDEAFPPAPEAIAALTPLDAPLILSVSRHDPRKGVNVLLRALARVRGKGLRFRACLASGGMLLAEHRRLAAQLGLLDCVAIPGWIPDPYPYLRHADVFALPSLQEASGSLALLEALQAGAAVVASNIDGIPEDVTDGDSALLVEPGNVDQLSLALARLLTETDLRTRLRHRAREVFAERFSAETFTRALRDLYAGLGFKGDDRSS